MSKYLNNKRISLVPFEEKYITAEYKSWVNDNEVTEHLMGGAYYYNEEELYAYYKKNLDSSDIFFAIIENETQRYIGTARIYNINWINKTAVRGIMLGDKDVWGKGYGIEVINLISQYAFNTLNLNKLRSATLVENIGIHKVNQKAGYQKEGEGREEFYRNGTYHNIYYWGLTRADYENNKKIDSNNK